MAQLRIGIRLDPGVSPCYLGMLQGGPRRVSSPNAAHRYRAHIPDRGLPQAEINFIGDKSCINNGYVHLIYYLAMKVLYVIILGSCSP